MRLWATRIALSVTFVLALAISFVVASELVPIRRNWSSNQFGGGAARHNMKRELTEEEVLAQVEEQTGPLTKEADDQVNSLTGNINDHNMILVWCGVGGNAAVAGGLLLWRKSQRDKESGKGGSFLQIVNNYVKPGISAAGKSKRKKKDKKSRTLSEKSSVGLYKSSAAGSIKSARSATGPASSIRSANSSPGRNGSTGAEQQGSKKGKASIGKAMSRFN